jgi:hypothetical protein
LGFDIGDWLMLVVGLALGVQSKAALTAMKGKSRGNSRRCADH